MKTKLGRREALHLAVVSAGAIALPACSGGGGAVGDVAIGNASALTVGQIKLISGVIVGRDANGVYAMSTVCTHQGCDMSDGVSATSVTCSCHGSRFDVDGNPVAGPARSTLEHYAVTADASGNLTAHGGQSVDGATRLKV